MRGAVCAVSRSTPAFPAAVQLDQGVLPMLRLAIVFLVIAMIAALAGFGNVAGFAWEGARILFFVFLVLAVISASARCGTSPSARAFAPSPPDPPTIHPRPART